MPTEATYSIADLARLTGVNVRTIRYYLAQGLLPASGENGPGAHYGEGHLHRLRLVKRLQAQHLPLAEIRHRLGQLTDEELRTLSEAPEEPRQVRESALEYIRGVLASPSPVLATTPPGAAPPSLPRKTSLLRMAAPTSLEPPVQASPRPTTGANAEAETGLEIERSQWERLSLGPNVELHVRRPLSRIEQKRVERLITIARQVLEEGKP